MPERVFPDDSLESSQSNHIMRGGTLFYDYIAQVFQKDAFARGPLCHRCKTPVFQSNASDTKERSLRVRYLIEYTATLWIIAQTVSQAECTTINIVGWRQVPHVLSCFCLRSFRTVHFSARDKKGRSLLGFCVINECTAALLSEEQTVSQAACNSINIATLVAHRFTILGNRA